MRRSAERDSGRRWTGAALLALGLVSIAAVSRAEVASDRAGAIVIFPKLLVDTNSGLDTLVRLSNTSADEQAVLCFYVNVTPECVLGQPGQTCFPDPTDCSGECVPKWQETDFLIQLTGNQPTQWLVSDGQIECRFFELPPGSGLCSDNAATSCISNRDCSPGARCVLPPCFRLDGIEREGPRHQRNLGRVPPAPEEPFIGELKCVAVDDTGNPVARNSLKGEVLIGHRDGADNIEVAGYNAIGIPAIAGRNNRDNTLVIGGAGAEYDGCPNILILDHFFDGAVDPVADNLCRDNLCSITGDACTTDLDCEGPFTAAGPVRVATNLTLIPCTQDFRTQNPDIGKTVAQFLIFNEFEQRFSTSKTVNCFREEQLSNIDTPQNERSIFSAGVAGTLTGQTRIRGVLVEGATDRGNTLLGVVEEFRCLGSDFPTCNFVDPAGLVGSSAANLHFQGTRPASDFIYLP